MPARTRSGPAAMVARPVPYDETKIGDAALPLSAAIERERAAEYLIPCQVHAIAGAERTLIHACERLPRRCRRGALIQIAAGEIHVVVGRLGAGGVGEGSDEPHAGFLERHDAVRNGRFRRFGMHRQRASDPR